VRQKNIQSKEAIKRISVYIQVTENDNDDGQMMKLQKANKIQKENW